MPLGLAIGTFVVLASIAGFVTYAVRTPGLQTPAYLWGLANGWFLYAIVAGPPPANSPVTGLPVIGPWLVSVTQMIVNPPIPRPDWLTEDMIGWAWPAVIALGVWLYVSKVLRFRPKFSLGAGAPSGGGARQQKVLG
jgi:hypothetical protein